MGSGRGVREVNRVVEGIFHEELHVQPVQYRADQKTDFHLATSEHGYLVLSWKW